MAWNPEDLTHDVMERAVRGFNKGGFVPGSGNTDTVPAMLTPGEFVIKKSSARAIGAQNLYAMNKYDVRALPW